MNERDWVKARFECTASEIFKKLIEALRKDIARFNSLSGTSPDARAFKPEHENGVFRVFRAQYVLSDGQHVLTKHPDHCNSANQHIQVELGDDTLIPLPSCSNNGGHFFPCVLVVKNWLKNAVALLTVLAF